MEAIGNQIQKEPKRKRETSSTNSLKSEKDYFTVIKGFMSRESLTELNGVPQDRKYRKLREMLSQKGSEPSSIEELVENDDSDAEPTQNQLPGASLTVKNEQKLQKMGKSKGLEQNSVLNELILIQSEESELGMKSNFRTVTGSYFDGRFHSSSLIPNQKASQNLPLLKQPKQEPQDSPPIIKLDAAMSVGDLVGLLTEPGNTVNTFRVFDTLKSQMNSKQNPSVTKTNDLKSIYKSPTPTCSKQNPPRKKYQRKSKNSAKATNTSFIYQSSPTSTSQISQKYLLPETREFIDLNNWNCLEWTPLQFADYIREVFADEEKTCSLITKKIMKESLGKLYIEYLAGYEDFLDLNLPREHVNRFRMACNGIVNYAHARIDWEDEAFDEYCEEYQRMEQDCYED
uniref:Uncharacterized protein n=1 Tax=Caenorhabditis tropicalis TaxID=1561998 RepID=A0A1I7T9Q6_9PELO